MEQIDSTFRYVFSSALDQRVGIKMYVSLANVQPAFESTHLNI